MADYTRPFSYSQRREVFNHFNEAEKDYNLNPNNVSAIVGTITSGSSSPPNNTNTKYVEATKPKPRGRPLGSKNKGKAGISTLTGESEYLMKQVVLDISVGSDLIDMVVQFAIQQRVGITILSVSGLVSNVTIHNPTLGSHPPFLTLQGTYNLLSLNGTFVGYPCPSTFPSSLSSTTCFGISLAGAQGEVFGGIVAGKVMATTQVVLVVSTFAKAVVHKFPQPLPSGDFRGDGDQNWGVGYGGAIKVCSSSMYGASSSSPLNSCHLVSPTHIMPRAPISCPPAPY